MTDGNQIPPVPPAGTQPNPQADGQMPAAAQPAPTASVAPQSATPTQPVTAPPAPGSAFSAQPAPVPPVAPAPPQPSAPKERKPQMLILIVSLAAIVIAVVVAIVLVNLPHATSSSSSYYSRSSATGSSSLPASMDIEADELTSDLTAFLKYDLESAGYETDSLQITDLTKESTTAPEYLSDYVISEAKGKATISYGGKSETIDYVSYYYADDPTASKITWYIFSYELSSYDLFPDGSTQDSTQGSSSSSESASSSSDKSALGSSAVSV